MSLPVIAIVGRPNVGKSTLFNRLVGRREAIVQAEPGVTRDRHFGTGNWEDRIFMVVDTGGISEGEDDPFHPLIVRQTAAAIEESDVVIVLVDGLEGLLPGDVHIARLVRNSGKPAVLALNKTDALRARESYWSFFELGLGEPISISAEHGFGVSEALERALLNVPEGVAEVGGKEGEIRVAVVGRPNVGKSSLINTLIGEERSLVSPVPGTTRDPIDSLIQREGIVYRFVDTAGIRKRGKIGGDKVEAVSMILAYRSIERAEAILLVIDATEGPGAIDANIARHVVDSGRACAVLLNKWDLVEKDGKTYDESVRAVHEKLNHISFAPVLSMSALTGQRTNRVYALIDQVIAAHRKRVPTARLNQALERWTSSHPPPSGRSGRRPKLLYITQVSIAPPQFVIFTARTEKLPETQYRRYIENRMREEFDFGGTSVRISFRKREAKTSRGAPAARMARKRKDSKKKGRKSK